jgi:IS5 family transposase
VRPDFGHGEPLLARRGLRISTGTIVDATIIAAPSSTRNSKKERDPEMHQTRKGNQRFFGAKTHIGVDSKEGIVHSVCTSATSVSDVQMLPDLLHGAEKKVWGDAGYQNQTEAIHAAAPAARAVSMKWSGARTAPRPGCARRWSGPSAS